MNFRSKALCRQVESRRACQGLGSDSIQGGDGVVESSESQGDVLDGSNPATTTSVVESSKSQDDILDGSDRTTITSVVESFGSQNDFLDGSDPTTTTSNSSLDQFKSELKSTLATLATLDNDSLVALSKDDEYVGILKQLVGPLALNKYACGALVGHIEGLSKESKPQHHFTIHFLPHTILPSDQTETKQLSLVKIVNENIATEVKNSDGQHIVNIKSISSPPSLVCTTHSPTLGRFLQPSIYKLVRNTILSDLSPDIFKDSHLADHRFRWWVRPEGEELYILHFVYMSTHYLELGTSTYLEAAIRKRYFRDMKDSKRGKMGDIPIGAMRWQLTNTPDSRRLVHQHRHYGVGWEAWFQVGLGKDKLGEEVASWEEEIRNACTERY